MRLDVVAEVLRDPRDAALRRAVRRDPEEVDRERRVDRAARSARKNRPPRSTVTSRRSSPA